MHNNEKYYFIERFEKSNIDLNKKIQQLYTGITKNYNIRELIDIKDYCRKKKKLLFLSNNIKLSINLSELINKKIIALGGISR